MEQMNREAITKLEWRVDVHDVRLNEQASDVEELTHAVTAIADMHRQTKWMGLGAGVVYFSDQFGLISALKFLSL
jgi:hypothetical protein